MRAARLLRAGVREASMVIVITLVAGSAAGVLARLIMRIASLTDAAPGVQGFTLSGTLRLIFYGVVPYYAFPATVLYALVCRWLPGSLPARALLFGIALTLPATLGLQLYLEAPLVAALFILLTIGYGAAVAYLFDRLSKRWPLG